MTDHPLITVLMPVCNGEKYLAEAIESILQQTFTRFEFLIIDDGSTDASVPIIRSYADSRIRLIINNENLGISATLNKGIELSKTALIARMDADDISYPERLQKQYEYFREHTDCALLSTAARTVSSDKTPIKVDQFKSKYFYYNLNFICWIYHPTVMYKRDAVLEVGKYSVPYSEDFDLWWRLSRKYVMAHLEEVLLDYRMSDKSLSHVAKRAEYEAAQQAQVLRNIHYYTGSAFHLTNSELSCYRHIFDPLVKRQSISAIIKCIQKLDYINQCILDRENVNRNAYALKQAFYFKKIFILQFFYTHLPANKSFWLQMRTKRILPVLINKVKVALKRQKKPMVEMIA